ncbi:MAG: acetylglutamate kinase, partial [Armatimonadota bacterium]|nr:acetylglutamate kinase [Armatimonadota bacterium]
MRILATLPHNLGRSLAEALRYVAAWKGRTVVVKFGGSVLDAPSLGTLPQDLVLLQQAGVRPVLVHGGGPEITRLLERLGKTTRFVNGLRVTDEETMEVVEMVLAGRVNKHLVTLIHRAGGRAVGLSGKDAALLRARRHA